MAGKTYADVLADIKKEFGIADDAIDKKLEKLIASADGAPLAEDIINLLRQQIQPSNIAFKLAGLATELKALAAAGWKSVPAKNRSALA